MNKPLLIFALLACMTPAVQAQVFNEIDEDGNITQRDESNRNFNPNSRDSVKSVEIPRGLYAWTVDRRFGDVHREGVDTLPHLYQNTVFNTGVYGEYNTTGNNYTPRLSRIAIDQPVASEFFFTQPYSFTMKEPDQFQFINTLSPFTNITYDNCGNNQNGEDHIDAKFAVNANKRLGVGFDLDYNYARGYFQNQSTSHFGATLFGSYIGDRYQLHAIFSTYHRKVAENGGISDDNYITHPESFDDQFSYEEIPTVLSRNWNRNNSQHLFLSHRYNIGFYRKVKMTDEELKARQFAKESAKDKQNRELAKGKADDGRTELGRREPIRKEPVSTGRPDNARIAGDIADLSNPKADTLATDSARIQIASQAALDSMALAQARQDSIDATMKHEYVPVTSIIHTLDINSHSRIYQAYASPTDYYANTYYDYNDEGVYGGDSIYDQTKYLSVKNTFALALLEGFNKYAKAGIKAFLSHEYRKYQMPDLTDDADRYFMNTWTGHCLSIGGQISKTQGHTLHYSLLGETCLSGMDAGSITLDFNADVNFPFLGDTVQLAAKANFQRLSAPFFLSSYHSKHLWWENELSSETRTRIEGLFSYAKTRTQLRVAIEEIQNYTYFGMSYVADESYNRTNMTAGVYQAGGNINLMTLQLRQDFRLGILNWENVLTYQNSSNQDVLPVPAFNLYTNLYLKFKIVRQLSVELGADAYFFTKYYAPDYVPQLGTFAVQQNADSRVELGGYPFVSVYANMHLKRARFFVMMSHVNNNSGTRMQFLAPHYPQNGSVLRMGVSWNFYN